MSLVFISILILVVLLGTFFLNEIFKKIFNFVFPERPKPSFFIVLVVIIIIALCIVVLASAILQEPDILFENLQSQPSNIDIEYPECKFIYEILEKGKLIQWIDTPLESGYWTGVQVFINESISLPAEWIMHAGNNHDILGPTPVPINTTVSIYAPYKCRPLDGP